jgi:DNA-binding IclR family transcriptional regulator
MTEDVEKSVAAVDRALALLEAFRIGDGPLSLAELARRSTLSKSTILRLAATLEKHGYLQRRDDGAYAIGPKPLQLGAIFQSMLSPPDVVQPLLRELAGTTGESASFMVRQGDFRVCLYRVDSPRMVRDNLRPGSILPMDKGAAGRVILAFTQPHPPQFAAIRRTIVDVSVAEITPEVASVCAPVFDASGVAGALALSGPAHRFDEARVAAMTAAILAGAQRMTTGLSGDPGLFARETAS